MLYSPVAWIAIFAPLAAFSGFVYFDNILNALATLLALAVLFQSHRLSKEGVGWVVCLLLVLFASALSSLAVNPQAFSFIAILAEASTLLIPLILIPLVQLPSSVIERSIRCFVFTFFWFCVFNIIVVGLQYIFGADVLPLRGAAEIQFDKNRPTGLFNNANAMADTFLMVFLAFHVIGYYQLEITKSIYFRFGKSLIIFLIAISSSKHAILALLIFFSARKGIKWGRIVFYSLMLAAISIIFYSFNIYNSQRKLDMYFYVLTKAGDVDPSLVESRVSNAISGFQLLKETFPLGYGLGTWGDRSSALNDAMTQSPFHNSMSDSFLVHIVVEQGVFALAYLVIIFYPIFRYKSAAGLSAAIIVVLLVTMGFNSSFWPICYAYIVFIALSSKKLKVSYGVS